MKVCYFGTYEKDYPRNRVMIKGLRQNGIEVIECHVPVWERRVDKTGSYLSFFSLIRIGTRMVFACLALAWKFVCLGKFDIMMVGYIGQMDVFLARFLLLFRRHPLIFNPLISLYDTLVIDRGIFQKGSVAAWLLYRIDRWSFRLADQIILDTNAHIAYITELFGIEKKKFVRVFVGADEEVFRPRNPVDRKDGLFRVLFYGKFIPLHGIHHILHAAKALEDDPTIRFKIIGGGQLSDEIHALARRLKLQNVDFVDWVPYEKLPEEIAEADLCLGIFGDTEKAKRVIPNKVFQALACGRPVLTLDTPAVRELGKTHNLLQISIDSVSDLSGRIVEIKNAPGGGHAGRDLLGILRDEWRHITDSGLRAEIMPALLADN